MPWSGPIAAAKVPSREIETAHVPSSVRTLGRPPDRSRTYERSPCVPSRALNRIRWPSGNHSAPEYELIWYVGKGLGSPGPVGNMMSCVPDELVASTHLPS